MKHYFSIVILPIVFAAFFADNFQTKITNKVATYQTALPQEKAYLQTDKPYYSLGDTIWFKSYLTLANQLVLDSLSKVIYVDLIESTTGKVVEWHQYPIKNGMAQGNIILSDSTLSGKYTIRTYNNWMKNFNPDFVFQKTIQIYNSPSPTPIFSDTSAFDIQFFPEGGNFVTGLNNRIGFKAIDPSGKGIEVNGTIISAAGDTLTTFSSVHLGMGLFYLTPLPQQNYFAIVRHGKGAWKRIELPKSQATGFAIQIDNFGNKTNVRAIISHNLNSNAEATLVVYGQGDLRLMAKVPLSRKTSLINIPRNLLGDGISYITLFDDEQKPVCERLIWPRKLKPLKLSIKTDKQNYRPRERIDVELNVTDDTNQPVEGYFSMAATDQSQVSGQHPYDQNIFSYFYLSSDLKGNIEQPAYYFDSTQSQAAFHLDNLLMTQGWRRFAWKEVLADTIPTPKYMIESGLNLSGNVTKLNGKTPGKVVVSSMITEKNNEQYLLKIESDENGRFEYIGVSFTDSTQVYIQAETPKKNRDLLVKLDKQWPALVSKNLNNNETTAAESAILKAYLQRMAEYRNIEERIRNSGEKLLGEVVIKSQKTVARDPRKIYSKPQNSLSGDMLKNVAALNPIEALQGRVAGLRIIGTGQNMTVNIRGASNFSGDIPPLYMIDGMYSDLQTLLNTPMSTVESIDVLKSSEATLFGSQGAGGVIAVYTKRGGPNYDFKNEKVPGTLNTTLMGFRPTMLFYSPKYDVNNNSKKPDFRSTLYWNPEIKTDRNGRAKLSFYNSDANSSILIKAEGLTMQQQAGANSVSYVVK